MGPHLTLLWQLCGRRASRSWPSAVRLRGPYPLAAHGPPVLRAWGAQAAHTPAPHLWRQSATCTTEAPQHKRLLQELRAIACAQRPARCVAGLALPLPRRLTVRSSPAPRVPDCSDFFSCGGLGFSLGFCSHLVSLAVLQSMRRFHSPAQKTLNLCSKRARSEPLRHIMRVAEN